MKKDDVQIGSQYLASVSGRKTIVEITNKTDRGWLAVNLMTRKQIRIRSAGRLTPHIIQKFCVSCGKWFLVPPTRTNCFDCQKQFFDEMKDIAKVAFKEK